MNKKEAYTILDLPEDASGAAIQTKYQERYSRLQVQITNAPDESLRLKYQQTLEQVKQAYAVLTSDTLNKSHLPSSNPVTQAAKTVESSTSVNNAAAATASSATTEKADKRFKIVFFWALLATALAVMLALLYKTRGAEIASKDQLIETLSRDSLALSQIAPNHRKKNKFVIKSEYDTDLSIIGLTAIFLNDAGELVTHKEEPDGEKIKYRVLKAGSSLPITLRKEDKVLEDARVLFYQLILQDNVTINTFTVAGAYTEDAVTVR